MQFVSSCTVAQQSSTLLKQYRQPPERETASDFQESLCFSGSPEVFFYFPSFPLVFSELFSGFRVCVSLYALEIQSPCFSRLFLSSVRCLQRTCGSPRVLSVRSPKRAGAKEQHSNIQVRSELPNNPEQQRNNNDIYRHVPNSRTHQVRNSKDYS